MADVKVRRNPRTTVDYRTSELAQRAAAEMAVISRSGGLDIEAYLAKAAEDLKRIRVDDGSLGEPAVVGKLKIQKYEPQAYSISTLEDYYKLYMVYGHPEVTGFGPTSLKLRGPGLWRNAEEAASYRNAIAQVAVEDYLADQAAFAAGQYREEFRESTAPTVAFDLTSAGQQGTVYLSDIMRGGSRGVVSPESLTYTLVYDDITGKYVRVPVRPSTRTKTHLSTLRSSLLRANANIDAARKDFRDNYRKSYRAKYNRDPEVIPDPSESCPVELAEGFHYQCAQVQKSEQARRNIKEQILAYEQQVAAEELAMDNQKLVDSVKFKARQLSEGRPNGAIKIIPGAVVITRAEAEYRRGEEKKRNARVQEAIDRDRLARQVAQATPMSAQSAGTGRREYVPGQAKSTKLKRGQLQLRKDPWAQRMADQEWIEGNVFEFVARSLSARNELDGLSNVAMTSTEAAALGLIPKRSMAMIAGSLAVVALGAFAVYKMFQPDVPAQKA